MTGAVSRWEVTYRTQHDSWGAVGAQQTVAAVIPDTGDKDQRGIPSGDGIRAGPSWMGGASQEEKRRRLPDGRQRLS